MGRRSFLGSVIGALAYSGAAFRASEAVAVDTTGQTLAQRLIRLRGTGPALRRKFRAAFLCTLDEEERLIWAPGVSLVDGWAWRFEPLVVNRRFTARGCKLVDDHGYVLGTTPFAGGVQPGDQLIVTHTLVVPPLAELKRDCAITNRSERLIVARQLGQPVARPRTPA